MSAKRRSGQQRAKKRPSSDRESFLRIVGGDLRGRAFRYSGDPATRPMKDRTREAVFNLLGPAIKSKKVIDLFAGTGAMGLEALSRGASEAVLIERRFPTARLIEENAAQLGVGQRVSVVPGDAFIWARGAKDLGPDAWVVFFCPPYALFVSRQQDMLDLVRVLVGKAPPGSLFVVESDQRFDTDLLPYANEWDVRSYSPAIVAILERNAVMTG